MKTFYGSENFKQVSQQYDIFLTLGSYDGVHAGHQKIIKTLIEKARKNNAKATILTYEPHPRILFGNNIKLLNTLEEKLFLFEKNGIDFCIVDKFDKEYASIPPEDFINKIICERINTKYILVGYDHRFGKKRLGDYKLLKQILEPKGISVEKIDEIVIDGEVVSSSKIRKLLLLGNIRKANKFLGYNYFISGKVVEGKKLGRTIGFPTANISVENPYKLIPKTGVYATRIEIFGEKFPSMTNIGFAPTLKGEQLTIETHIFNFSRDIYNQLVSLEFVEFIRDEKKFSSVEELRKQLVEDRNKALQILGV